MSGDAGFPEWARGDAELMAQAGAALARLEWLQRWMARHLRVDDPGVPPRDRQERAAFMARFVLPGQGGDGFR